MRALTALSLLCVLGGCRPPMLPGESLGNFRVEATLETTTCGDGVPAEPTLAFAVELRADDQGSRGWWKLPDGPAIQGRVDAEGFRFVNAQQIEAVQPDPDLGYVGCALEQREVVEGALDETQMPLSGTSVVTFSTVAGTDCTPLLTPQGGAFPALPCELRYSLEGARVEE